MSSRSPSAIDERSANWWSSGTITQQVLGEQRLDHQLGVVDREVDDGRVELPGQRRSGSSVVVLPSWTIGVDAAGGRGATAASSCGISHRAVVPITPMRASPDDVGVERGHVGGDVVDLVQDPAGPLDDPRALLGEAALGAVDEARRRAPSRAWRRGPTRWTARCRAPAPHRRTCRGRRSRRAPTSCRTSIGKNDIEYH